MMRYKAFRFQQPSTAIDKNLYFKCGFRPLVVKMVEVNALFLKVIAVRDLAHGNSTVTYRDGSDTAVPQGSNGVGFEDDGFTVQTGPGEGFRTASAVWLIEAFGDTDEHEVVTMSADLPLRIDDPFGAGTQYDPIINEDGSGEASVRFSDSGIYRAEE